MVEVELKFQVPAAQRAGLRRAVATASARRTRLQALYHDTPQRHLAAAGLALRLRKQGRHWVQTLKGRGDGAMQRLEHEVVLPPGRGVPALDPARHAGTPAGERLAQALGDAAPSLAVTFATDIRRTHRVLHSGGARIELALDEGVITSGAARLPVCELELELLAGPASALPALAARWVRRHGLWLDVRSKAERGDRLARGVVSVAATGASPPALRRDMTLAQALAATAGACLDQVLPNAAELCAGSGGPEHLHQLRVGLRRLRSASAAWGDGLVDPAWDAPLRTLFRALGAQRDRDVLRATLAPAFAADGAPPVEMGEAPPVGAPTDAGALLRGNDVQALLLAWLRLSVDPPPVPTPLAARLDADLQRLRRQAVRDAKRFDRLDEAARHRVRRRLKRLRYVSEFVAPLYPPKRARRFLAALRPAQELLGQYNDLGLAHAACAAAAEADPRAWFALGWLAARREVLATQAQDALQRLADTPRFWRR